MLEHTVPYTSVYRIPYYHLLPHSYRKPHQPQVHVVPDTQAHVGNNPIHISQLDLPGCEQWPEPLSKSSQFVGWQENQIDGWMDGWMLTAYYCISPFSSISEFYDVTAQCWQLLHGHINWNIMSQCLIITSPSICSSSLLFIAVCCGLFSWSFDRLGNPQPQLESAGNFEIFEHTQIMSDQLLHMLQQNDFWWFLAGYWTQIFSLANG